MKLFRELHSNKM